MNHFRFLIVLPALLSACATSTNKDSIGQLADTKIELKDVKIEGGAEKAMRGYQKFLEQAPESTMTPEALRRLADLKIQNESGALDGKPGKSRGNDDSGADFEKNASKSTTIKPKTAAEPIAAPDGSGAEIQSAGTLEAIGLYKKLLSKFPNYERNDQVLYQLSRAYDEVGQAEEAMKILNRLAREYPNSRYIDEVQFRRGENFFVLRKYPEAEASFKSIVNHGKESPYFELALYKLGWTYYKQERYEESLHRFIALLDHEAKSGHDIENPKGTANEKRIDDIYRVISLAFSNLGGADAIAAYFNKNGRRYYEAVIYNILGDHYLDKRRYDDAASTFKAFVKLNPYHKAAPHFDARVIEAYKKGGFSKLAIAANKDFAANYGLLSRFWEHHDIKAFPEVMASLKTSLKELANNYHALYQEKKFEAEKAGNFQEASKWYREFLNTFPREFESPNIHFQLAELLLENKAYGQAAFEYERVAYDYPFHDKSADAGYAAVYAQRENMAVATPVEYDTIKQNVIRSSIQFAEAFPKHEKAALVMAAAVDDLYTMKKHELAISTGHKLLDQFPDTRRDILRSTWLIIAHASFDLMKYSEAEEGYQKALKLTDKTAASRTDVLENLAASVYKQGEQANTFSNFKAAAGHFLRVAKLVPASTIRPVADFDGATALIQLKDWNKAAEVLNAFRNNHPGHKLQPEVTKKMAYVYKEAGQLSLAASEYERMETESTDTAVRRETLQVAAGLYLELKDTDKAIQVYRRFVDYFPKPLEPALDTRIKIADALKSKNDTVAYFGELRQIVLADAQAGAERSDRTRYLAATSSQILAEPLFEQFAAIRLVKPFDTNLLQKKNAMKLAKDSYEKLLAYEIGDITSAATYYIAEMYYNFNRSLVESERPDDLNPLEKEQYELGIEEQAYPFEEKAIQVHEKNLELLTLGIYNNWIDKSLDRLAKLVPARYAKYEESSGYIEAIDTVSYASLTAPMAAPQNAIAAPAAPMTQDSPVPATEPAPAQTETSAPEAAKPVAADSNSAAGKKAVKAKKKKPAKGDKQ